MAASSPVETRVCIEEQFRSFWPRFGSSPSMRFHREPGLVRWFADAPVPMFNGVFSQNLSDPEAAVAQHLEFFRSHKAPMIWCVGTGDDQSDMARLLGVEGLAWSSQLVGMARELSDLTVRGDTVPLRIERPVRAEALLPWTRPFMASFDFPSEGRDFLLEYMSGAEFGLGCDVTHYVGWEADVPVVCASLVLGDGVAGLYNVGTLPQHRGRGFATAVTLAALLDARAAGMHLGVLHASSQGARLYRNLGFREYCRIPMYVWAV